MRLLCASHQVAARAELVAALRAAGFAADLVADLDAAQDVLLARSYQVAIIGAGARADGAARWIRRRRAEGWTLALMLQVGGDGVEDRIIAFEAGADDCFRMPITPRELIARIRALLPPALLEASAFSGSGEPGAGGHLVRTQERRPREAADADPAFESLRQGQLLRQAELVRHGQFVQHVLSLQHLLARAIPGALPSADAAMDPSATPRKTGTAGDG